MPEVFAQRPRRLSASPPPFLRGGSFLALLFAAIGLGWVADRGAPALSEGEAAPPTTAPAPENPGVPAGATASTGSARTPDEAPEIASYRLEAVLDDLEHRVLGRGSIRWTNASTQPAHDLYFHLYLNAFSSERTLFMRSPFVRSRSGSKLRTPGSLQVNLLSSRRYGDRNLWEDAAEHSPNDPDDATDIRVPLPNPILPGETVEFDVEFTATLPNIVERTGFADSFHMVAQWFPKLARREPNGRWAHFAFHPHAEFYADFGRYDVSLDVPSSMVVGATGTRIEEHTENDRRIERYFAQGVHDFAWTAWDGFEIEEKDLFGVNVTLLAPAHSEPARRATWSTIEHGLPLLGRRYGTYPHPTLTVVHPPAFAAGAGGMEYPTLITTGGSSRWPRLGVRLIEQVAIHELAHQWFQGMLASNEVASPFLDEGLTSYAEWVALDDQFGNGSLLDVLGLSVSLQAAGRAATVGWGRDEIIGQPAAAFTSMRSLAAHVYSGTATALSTLGRVFGEERLEQALREYALRHRFSHPTPDDLLASVRQYMGKDAANALRIMLFERGRIDLAVTEMQSVPDPQAGPSRWRNRVVVARRGNLELPVVVRLELTDGQTIDHPWDGHEATLVLELAQSAALKRATVDPDRRVLLDEDLLNNSRATTAGSSARASERAWYWAELLLHLLGS